MIVPLIFIHKHKIKGEGGIFLKKNKPLLNRDKEDKKQFLTQYHVFIGNSQKCIGSITLEKNTDRFGGNFFTYKFHKSVSPEELTGIFRCLLGYVKNFYGWNVNDSQNIQASDIFQEVKIKIKKHDPDLLPILKGGFKVSFVNKNHYILRHRYEDKTSLEYKEVAEFLYNKKEKSNLLMLVQKHYQKIEQAIRRNEEVQSSDIETLKFYSTKDQESWQYCLFLLRENPKIYLDHVRTMTTLEKIYS